MSHNQGSKWPSAVALPAQPGFPPTGHHNGGQDPMLPPSQAAPQPPIQQASPITYGPLL